MVVVIPGPAADPATGMFRPPMFGGIFGYGGRKPTFCWQNTRLLSPYPGGMVYHGGWSPGDFQSTQNVADTTQEGHTNMSSLGSCYELSSRVDNLSEHAQAWAASWQDHAQPR
jgi:hypothetical protein